MPGYPDYGVELGAFGNYSVATMARIGHPEDMFASPPAPPLDHSTERTRAAAAAARLEAAAKMLREVAKGRDLGTMGSVVTSTILDALSEWTGEEWTRIGT